MKEAIVFTIIAGTTILISCSGNGVSTAESNDEVSLEKAKLIYFGKCASCHGHDGRLGLNGARDLTTTELSIEAIEQQIKQGKGVMPAFKNELTEGEVKGVAQYIRTELRF